MKTHQNCQYFAQTHQLLAIALLHSLTKERSSPLRFEAAAEVIDVTEQLF